MKTFIFSTLMALMLAGCQATYDSYSDRESLYIDGSYGWVVQEYELAYSYDYYLEDSLYFETPYLQDGRKVYIDIYNDYGYAYIDVNDWSMFLVDQWFNGAYEAHYVFEVGESGYHYFQIGDMDRDTVVHIYYQ